MSRLIFSLTNSPGIGLVVAACVTPSVGSSTVIVVVFVLAGTDDMGRAATVLAIVARRTSRAIVRVSHVDSVASY